MKKKAVKISDRIADEVIYKGKRLHLYFILDDGNIYSLRHLSNRGFCSDIDEGGVILKTRIPGKAEYPLVNLMVNGESKTIAIHRLVCENFHPLPEKYPGISARDWKKTPVSVKKELMKNMQVNHKDGNKKNYHPDNLEWTTGEENRNHYHKVLRLKCGA